MPQAHEPAIAMEGRPRSFSAPVASWDRWLLRKLLASLGNMPLTVVLWNGEEISSPGPRPQARIRCLSRGAIHRLLLNPELGFGDLYTEGLIRVEGDLVKFLEIYHRAHGGDADSLAARLLGRASHSLARCRDDIYHHYDVGNDFYELWLDREAMQYTCAYFPEPDMSLEEAQTAKMHHICRKLRLAPGQSVIEAGCGWGGLSRFMARHYGVRVRAYNISHEQVSLARRLCAAAGLNGRVEYVEDDYRNIQGRCDAFVSIGMLEHVGIENYPLLGVVIDRCLAASGHGLIHTIGRNRQAQLNAWIRRRIFPGGQPPTLGQMMSVFEPTGFSVLDVENLRLHYAKTAEHWLARFERHAANIRRIRGEEFERAWRLYLAGTVAGFSAGTLQLFQVVFTRAQVNDQPWSRGYLYEDRTARAHGAM